MALLNRRLLVAVVGVIGVALSCEPARQSLDYPAQTGEDAGAGPDAGRRLDAGRPADALDPSGTWLAFFEDRHCLLVLNQSIEYVVWTYYIVELEPLGPGAVDGQLYVRQRLKICAEETSPTIGNLVTYIPNEVVDSIPATSVDAILAGIEVGDSYVSQEMFDTWGLRDVGEEEPLPTSSDDPRVVDQDADGEPGVSLILGNDVCEVRVVQRTRYRSTGRVVSPSRIEGTFWSTVDQNVLEATQSLCETRNALIAGTAPNGFVLQRADDGPGGLGLDVDADGDVDCKDLRAAQADLLDQGILTKEQPRPDRCQ